MVKETDFEYEIETELADFNENKLMKPYGYQKLCNELGDMHLSVIDMNVDITMKSNLAWALTSLSVEIAKPVEGNIKLRGKTWYSGRKGPLFRREYLFTDVKGDVLFKAASFSVLLDMEKRTIYRKKELPFNMSEPINEFIIEAKINKKMNLDYIKLDERKAYNSYIDPLGHVNNCRYGEFAYDTFTDVEVENLRNLKRMDIYFRSELRKNDNFTIHKAYDEDSIYIRGENDTKKDISFDIYFTF
ncbi:MAG: thioesterase [Tissierellaceae bacterium]|nr:thioesterase [Tissierellaceae bacterium]